MLHKGSTHIFILIYVDDIIVIDTHLSTINTLITNLQAKFKLKNLRYLSYFLDIHVQRSNECLDLSRSKYILDLLKYAWNQTLLDTLCFRQEIE